MFDRPRLNKLAAGVFQASVERTRERPCPRSHTRRPLAARTSRSLRAALPSQRSPPDALRRLGDGGMSLDLEKAASDLRCEVRVLGCGMQSSLHRKSRWGILSSVFARASLVALVLASPALADSDYPAGLFERSPLNDTPAAASSRGHNSPRQAKNPPRERASGGCHHYREWRYPWPQPC